MNTFTESGKMLPSHIYLCLPPLRESTYQMLQLNGYSRVVGLVMLLMEKSPLSPIQQRTLSFSTARSCTNKALSQLWLVRHPQKHGMDGYPHGSCPSPTLPDILCLSAPTQIAKELSSVTTLDTIAKESKTNTIFDRRETVLSTLCHCTLR